MTPQSIAETLESDILSGALPPGTPLHQVELAERFGVSRIPVRDALAQLASQGVIVAAPNRTATVLKLSVAEVEELYDLRIMLECDLLDHAVARMRDAHLAAIHHALAQSALEATQDNWAEGDAMFHTALYAAADRPRQLGLINELRRIARVQIAGYNDLTDKTHRWLSEHEGIVQACDIRDSKEAQRRLRRHLRAARNHLVKAMKAEVG